MWQGGLKAERERLEESLPKIQALLDAIDRSHFLMGENPTLEKWMWQFRDAVDEAEDFMHEIEYERLEKEIEGEKNEVSYTASRVKRLKTIDNRGLHQDSSLLKLKEVVELLDKAVSGMGHFLKSVEIFKKDKQPLATSARQTGSFLTVKTRVFGRENEKEEVINKLLNSNPTSKKNFCILPIVGVGGVGKTTLAQFVYNDERIQKHFNKRMWVCVSNNPNLELLTQKIYDESTSGEKLNLVNLNKLQEKISDELKSQRFLLVLDDVWDDISNISPDTLLAPLKSGGMGSMILLTTRIRNVEETRMDTLEPVFLYGLGEGEYWEFFKECAFRDEDLERYKILQDTGRKIAKKLKGSLLAAKTVGALLRANLDDEHWENILNSEIWKLEQNDNDIMPALKLSYQYLPSHLKPCFRFCSIFPQDYQFKKEKLVYMWMALGLLHKSKYGTARPEDIGDEYFNDLVGKSIIDCKTDLYGGTYYVMHDLLHELATSVSNGECIRIDDSSELIHIPESVRHLSINTSVSLPIPEIAKLKYLRTLLLLEESNPSYRHIPEVLKGLKSLRILDSTYFQITDDCFSNLKHICYLRNNGGYGVPKSVNKLYHLQFLEYYLVNSHTHSEPDHISNLINLRRLRTPNSVRGIVHDLGRLTSLQILEGLDVGKGNNVNKIVELKNLRELRELGINNLVDVTMVEEAVEANLKAKEHLWKLRLDWAWFIRDHGSHEVDEQVLDALQPHSNLKRLVIIGYMGRRIPCWMTVSKIISITLSFCKGIVDLSPVGQLSHLESLELKYMDSVKRVGAEPAGKGTENRVFPSLQMLRIHDLPALEEFYGGASQWLPCLKELSIDRCPNLRVFPNLPCGLRKLYIFEVHWVALPELWVQSGNNESLSSHLSSLEIKFCPCLTSLSEGLLMHSELFTSLEKLAIWYCKELTHSPIGGFSKFTSLKELKIQDCPKLRRGSTSGRFLPSSLQTLRVTDCDVLDPLPRSPEDNLNLLSDVTLISCASIASLPSAQVLGRWKALEQLHIENCSELESLGGLQALSSLKNLTVKKCPNLRVISECEELTHLPIGGFSKFTSLKELKIQDCPKLRRGSTSGRFLPSSLQTLRVTDCDVLDPLPRSPEDNLNLLSDVTLISCASIASLPSAQVLGRWKALEQLHIENCSELESLGGLQALSSLKNLTVIKCPKLVATAPSSLSPSIGSLILDELTIDDPLLLCTEQLKSISARDVDLDYCLDVRSSALEEWALKNNTTLQRLNISRVSLGGLQALPSLKYLIIKSVSSQQFPLAELQSFSCLKSLEVSECWNLQSLPDLPSSLNNLFLEDCSPELEERCLKDSGPDWPKIQHISQVVIGDFNKDELATMTPAEQIKRRQEINEEMGIEEEEEEEMEDEEEMEEEEEISPQKSHTYVNMIDSLTYAQVYGPMVHPHLGESTPLPLLMDDVVREADVQEAATEARMSAIEEDSPHLGESTPLPLFMDDVEAEVEEATTDVREAATETRMSAIEHKIEGLTTDIDEIKANQTNNKKRVLDMQSTMLDMQCTLQLILQSMKERQDLPPSASLTSFKYAPSVSYEPIKLKKITPIRRQNEKKVDNGAEVLDLTTSSPVKLKVVQTPISQKIRRQKDLIKENEKEMIDMIAKIQDDNFIVWASATTHVLRSHLVEVINGDMVNSEIINCRQIMYEMRGAEDKFTYTPCCFMDATIVQALEGKNETIRTMCLRPVLDEKLREYNFLLIPLIIASHWHLLSVDLKKGVQMHYSSIIGDIYFEQAKKVGEQVKRLLFTSYRDIYDNGQNWDIIQATDIPTQHQSADCGIFLLEYEDRIQRSINVVGFTQKNMKRLRIKLALEIAQDGVLGRAKGDRGRGDGR